jgi:hypothetical protein
MIRGCFGSDLDYMPGDLDSKKGEVTSASYIEVQLLLRCCTQTVSVPLGSVGAECSK